MPRGTVVTLDRIDDDDVAWFLPIGDEPPKWVPRQMLCRPFFEPAP